MMKKKNIVMVTMLAVVVVMSIAYAFFTTNLSIISTGSISSSWDVKFISITNDTPVGSATNIVAPSYTATTATMSAGLNLPGDSITYRITLKNNGDMPAIIEDIDATATGSGAIIFSISGLNIGEKLASKEEKVIVVKIEYDPNTTSQPVETTKTLTVSIKAVQDTGQDIGEQIPGLIQGTYLKNAIFRDNIAYADNEKSEFVNSDKGIDFSQISSDTNGKGLYYTSKNTEGNGTTYYFRGNVQNNYVKFGNITTTRNTCTYNGQDVYALTGTATGTYDLTKEVCLSTNVCYIDTAGYVVGLDEKGCLNNSSDSDGHGIWTNEKATYTENVKQDVLWRIVRINEDGSIRLITDDIIGSSRYSFNPNYDSVNNVYYSDDNTYVGYMKGTLSATSYEQAHSDSSSSEIKTYLDNWYDQHLGEYSIYLSDGGFCNDRSVNPEGSGKWATNDTALGYGTQPTYYSSYKRMKIESKPQFKCEQERDYFTLTTSNVGNKKLTRPIGLITVDELGYAGSVYDSFNEDVYISSGHLYWTMSPRAHYSSKSFVWYIDPNGDIHGGGSAVSHGVKPVINLKSTIEITGGNGTSTDPYIIKTN